MKILFIAECITLAHMARPAVLARALDEVTDGVAYDIVFAADHRFDALFPDLPGTREGLSSIPSEQFLEALAKGTPVYDAETLTRYVKDDLALLERVQPDVVVGDFRLSLSISARLAKVPYATISNLYWSPYARQRYPVPELPMTQALGVGPAQVLFNLARPIVFATHASVLNKVRKRFGLHSLGPNLRRVYTDADLTLYADLPGLIETAPLPPTHRRIGPIIWSPPTPLPPWWDQLGDDLPLVYITPGSSGDVDGLDVLAEALSQLPVNCMLATAGRWTPTKEFPRLRTADYLPGLEAARRASVVICNGGSPTTAQALMAGCPVIGIAKNLDQHLNMQAVEQAGLGIRLRNDRLSGGLLVAAVNRIISNESFKVGAGHIAAEMARAPVETQFREVLREFLSKATI